MFALALAAWLVMGGFPLLMLWLGAGLWLLLRVARAVSQKAVWRLRHRLIITYVFIAVAPVVLLASLAAFAGYFLMLQIAMNVVTTELDHRLTELSSAADAIAQLDNPSRVAGADAILAPYFTTRYEGLAVLLRDGEREIRFPKTAEVPPPVVSAQAAKGMVRRGRQYYFWSYRKTPNGDVTIAAPLTRKLLDQLAPELGLVDAASSMDDLPQSSAGSVGALPPQANWLDVPVPWFAQMPAADWMKPAVPSEADGFVIDVRTRISALLAKVFNRKADTAQGLTKAILIAGAVLFVFVEIICWVIGVSMTRTITGTVHHLYEGTQRVMEGNFEHRMEVAGRDQLAEVGASFNRMTDNLQRLVTVAKEKERLQSEIEIASEVQNQLYPRIETRTADLQVAAVCKPARMVSGDYFDYEMVGDGQVALAIGDVSGKGISAALLMATLQSSLRTQLKGAAGSNGIGISTAVVVDRLNRNLCASSTPDKYATFCLGLYNPSTGVLLYTNAGHLPPLLIRGGQVERLDVNGMVVGAFDGVLYEESRIKLESGDLLVFFTDGLTEPENEFGEMFGEERFIDLVAKNSHRDEQRIVEIVLTAVREWTGPGELQDDMTLLLARRA
ncbi:MAG: SpoIIE family protein phosphatase [Acidobacteriota bacterium]